MTGRERGGEPVGLYLHIPFCRSKCPFCDFCSFPRPDAAMVEAYVDELIRRRTVTNGHLAFRPK